MNPEKYKYENWHQKLKSFHAIEFRVKNKKGSYFLLGSFCVYSQTFSNIHEKILHFLQTILTILILA